MPGEQESVRVRHTGVYIGGPLDGARARPNPGCAWSIYRDDAGAVLRTSRGDWEFFLLPDATWGDRDFLGITQPRRYYIHPGDPAHDQDLLPQTTGPDGTLIIRHVYVHATVWASWHGVRCTLGCCRERREPSRG